jgi:hypothetical protein
MVPRTSAERPNPNDSAEIQRARVAVERVVDQLVAMGIPNDEIVSFIEAAAQHYLEAPDKNLQFAQEMSDEQNPSQYDSDKTVGEIIADGAAALGEDKVAFAESVFPELAIDRKEQE